jgi:hypothetical protein
VANIDVLVAIYLGGWLLVTLAGYIASRWFGHRWSPPPHPLLVSALAGAVWPLLLIGLIELSAIAVYANLEAKPEAVWSSSFSGLTRATDRRRQPMWEVRRHGVD